MMSAMRTRLPFISTCSGVSRPTTRSRPIIPLPQDVVAAVARAVAEAAGHSFLVALIVSRTLLSSTEIPDPDDPDWRASLPGTAAAAMHSDLQTRLGAEADRARDLLRPLAFAQGAGLPWEDMWAPLSSKLSGRDYTDEDLIWLRRQAGSYVIEAMESGHSVYRLYHAALAEYLRQGRDEDHIHRQFSNFLIDRVPTSRSGPDWSRAHPYILAHLATHAQRAGTLDSLLLDPGYLVNAGPAGLLAALPAVRDPDAELAGRAYQRAVHQLQEPARRRSPLLPGTGITDHPSRRAVGPYRRQCAAPSLVGSVDPLAAGASASHPGRASRPGQRCHLRGPWRRKPGRGQHRPGCEAADLGRRDGRASWHLYRRSSTSGRDPRRSPARSPDDHRTAVRRRHAAYLGHVDGGAAADDSRGAALAPAYLAAQCQSHATVHSARPMASSSPSRAAEVYAHLYGTCRRVAE